jgi:hypothetical protein
VPSQHPGSGPSLCLSLTGVTVDELVVAISLDCENPIYEAVLVERGSELFSMYIRQLATDCIVVGPEESGSHYKSAYS